MGSIYKIKNRNRWRVQFKRIGHKTIDACFETYDEAKEFHDIVKKTINEKKMKVKIKEVLKKIKNN